MIKDSAFTASDNPDSTMTCINWQVLGPRAVVYIALQDFQMVLVCRNLEVHFSFPVAALAAVGPIRVLLYWSCVHASRVPQGILTHCRRCKTAQLHTLPSAPGL